MKESTTREKVLKKVRNSLIDKTMNPYSTLDMDSPIYPEMTESLKINFAEELTKINGKFVYCENENDMIENLKYLISENNWKNIFCFDPNIGNILDNADINFKNTDDKFDEIEVGITACEYLIARLGTVMVSSRQITGRRLNFYPPVHIAIAYADQLVPDVKDALLNISDKYIDCFPSMVTMIAGPSRTADIEKTLIMGAHGPKDLYVFLIDKNKISE